MSQNFPQQKIRANTDKKIKIRQEGLSNRKEKRKKLMDTENSVVIVGRRWKRV